MIQFLCPGCEKKLAVGNDKGGKIASCPKCKTRFQIPEADPNDVEDRVTPEPPLKRRPTRSDPDDVPPRHRESRRPRHHNRDDDDLPDAEIERPRKKKRRKRRPSSEAGGFELPLGLDVFWLAPIGALVIGLLLLGIGVIFPPLLFLATFFGGTVGSIGSIWFLVVAFQDDTTQGVLCLVVPVYSLFYALTNFEEVKRPFSLWMIGAGIAILSSCAGIAVHGAR